MSISEYTPKQYLLIELPYSRLLLDRPEAIALEHPVGACIVPPTVWNKIKRDNMLNEMKNSGELISTISSDGTEWFDCPMFHTDKNKLINSKVSHIKAIGACFYCNDNIYDEIIKCYGCNKVLCNSCQNKIAGYVFCTNTRCSNSRGHWTSMREDGLTLD